MAIFSKASLKFTDSDAERIVVKSLDHLKMVLAQVDTEILLCPSGNGIITVDAAKGKILSILRGDGKYNI